MFVDQYIMCILKAEMIPPPQGSKFLRKRPNNLQQMQLNQS